MTKNINLEKEKLKNNQTKNEKALLVFINFKSFKSSSGTWEGKIDFNQNIEELKNLAISAGAEVDSVIIHNQDKPNPGFFISLGKLEEIKNLVSEREIDIVIFDEEISSTQQSNLQEKLGIKVIDRTALILDIFAQRAYSSEGKLQVELAQLNYMSSRLTGKGVELSRLGGGIGTRGPGETKLEVDRRKIKKRIGQLEKKIEEISTRRDVQRKRREEKNVFEISLVGYTNSGKSTLLNATTGSNVLIRNMLFSTLDSTTRKLEILSGYEVLISDTVGFIEKLPHQLIASFKSTLEEVRRADLLLMVVDISNPNFENHILSVKKVLNEIHASDKYTILVFNKIDKVSEEILRRVKLKYKDAIFISALKKIGLEELCAKIKDIIESQLLSLILKVPYTESKTLSFIYQNCEVLKRDFLEDGVLLSIRTDFRFYPHLSKFIYTKTKEPLKLKSHLF